jgi:hypothetical protein
MWATQPVASDGLADDAQRCAGLLLRGARARVLGGRVEEAAHAGVHVCGEGRERQRRGGEERLVIVTVVVLGGRSAVGEAGRTRVLVDRMGPAVRRAVGRGAVGVSRKGGGGWGHGGGGAGGRRGHGSFCSPGSSAGGVVGVGGAL